MLMREKNLKEEAQQAPLAHPLARANLQYIKFIDKVSGASVQLISFRMLSASHLFRGEGVEFTIHLQGMFP